MSSPSDFFLVASGVLAAFFVLDYGTLSPWYKAPLGVVVFLYAVVAAAVFGLIAYGILFDQRIPEPIRLIVGVGVFCALSAKITILHLERRAGRRERSNERQNDDR